MEIKICLGTYCHLMGASEIYTYLENYLESHKNKFILNAVACLGVCNTEKDSAPIIQIDDKIHKNMDINKLNNLLNS